MIISLNNLLVSKHARQRLRQRYYNHFHSSNFLSDHMTDSLIMQLVINGQRVTWWENCPFYKNKINSIYGNMFIVKSKIADIHFSCFVKPSGAILVTTVMSGFNPATVKFK